MILVEVKGHLLNYPTLCVWFYLSLSLLAFTACPVAYTNEASLLSVLFHCSNSSTTCEAAAAAAINIHIE